MRATVDLMDALKKRHGLISDYQLAQHLGLTRAAVSHYRSGRSSFDDSIALRVADELDLPRAAVLAAMAGERSRNDDVRKAWRDAVKKLGGVAAAVAMLLGGGPTPPSATAGPISHNQVRNTQCTTRRRLTLGVALRRFVAALLPAALAACSTTVGHVRAPDWPRLNVIEHHVKAGDIYARCAKYISAEQRALAWLTLTPPIVNGCAEVDFAAMTCTIWVRGDIPDPEVLEHERAHCAGGDHVGERPVLAEAWAAWKAAMTREGAYVYIRADGQQASIPRAR